MSISGPEAVRILGRLIGSAIMRPAALLIVLVASACVSQPKADASWDNCLTDEPAGWRLLAAPPPDSAFLKSLAISGLANPPTEIEQRWYASGDSLLYCRRQDGCVAESWKFAREGETWRLVDHHAWICVASHDKSFRKSSL